MTLAVFPLTFQQAVGFPIKQTPQFNSLVQDVTSDRGIVQIPTYDFPLWNFSIDLSYLRGDATTVNSTWQQMINFYMSVQGGGCDWLFLHPYDNIVGEFTITGAVTSGVFIVNENVKQTTTNAIAKLLFAVTGSNTMDIGPYTGGTPDGVTAHTWVGQTSGAIYTPSAAPVLAESQAMAIGDGFTTKFTMLRTLVPAGAQDMMQNFLYAPTIYINNVVVSSSTYTLDEYGTLTFTVAAPPSGLTISWTGQFYYRCRFITDKWESLQEDLYTYWSAEGIRFQSVLL